MSHTTRKPKPDPARLEVGGLEGRSRPGRPPGPRPDARRSSDSGRLVGVLGLIGLLALAAGPIAFGPRLRTGPVVANVPPPAAEAVKIVEPPKRPIIPEAPPKSPGSSRPDAEAVADRYAKARDFEAQADPTNPDDAGIVRSDPRGRPPGLGSDPNGWERVEAKAPLKLRTRFLNLAPFRNTLKLGKAEVELVDSTDVDRSSTSRKTSRPGSN